ncbi:hypothetical protein GBF38_007565 [Nibea albiflora]|uniref:Uncharacterized protein n=1 Tax=Nibea albiflora TaxID=240163 RepID=A0ACB7EM24_NIBAL|nr:hypothetical protein GBF38_007565 [Nibea albiflora]
MQRPRNPRGDQRSDEEQTTVRGCSCETSCQLNQELEETKEQLKRQKSLKEMFINKEKETRRELERLKKYTDPETLSTAKICQPGQRHHQEKEEETLAGGLRRAAGWLTSLMRRSLPVTFRRRRTTTNFSSRNWSDSGFRTKCSMQVRRFLRASWKMLNTQLSVQVSLNLKLSTELKAERRGSPKITSRDDNQPPKEAEVAEKQEEQQETTSPALALEPQREAQGTLPDRTAPPPSVWKRTRHFLGLRKPERWKRRRED